ncbi:MAG: LytTR family transcriptional regulator DNA-binding domain-containing protein [Bacteroidota bacterium]
MRTTTRSIYYVLEKECAQLLKPFLGLMLVMWPCVHLAQGDQMYHFGAEADLASLEVYDVAPEPGKGVWFGTDLGVNFYDGFTFKTFTQSDGLGHNCSLMIKEDNWGRFWIIGLDRSLSICEGGKVRPYRWNSQVRKAVTQGNWIQDLAWDAQGNLTVWFYRGTGNRVFTIDEGSGLSKFLDLHDDADGPPQWVGGTDSVVFINGLLVPLFRGVHLTQPDPSGSILYYVTGGNNSVLVRVDIHDPASRESIRFGSQINDLYADDHGALWVCTREGVHYYEEGNLQCAPRRILTEMATSRVAQDPAGGYWITTLANGVYYLPSLDVHEILPREMGGTLSNMQALEPAENWLYGSTQKGRLIILSPQHEVRTLINQLDQFNNFQWIEASEAEVLASGFQGVIDADSVSVRKIFDSKFAGKMHRLPDGRLFLINHARWEIRDASGRDSLDYGRHKGIGRIKALLDDGDRVLIGTGSGLYSFLPEACTVRQETFSGKPIDFRVRDMARDDFGNIWISTDGDGLIYRTPHALLQIGEAAGLNSNMTGGISCSDSGRVLVSSNRGLSQVKYHYANGFFELLGITTITTIDGLPSNFLTDVANWREQIYLASDRGLHHFDPSLFDLVDQSPPVHFGNASLDGRPLEIQGQAITLEATQVLGISYTAYLPVRNPADPIFRYRVRGDGTDTTWRHTNAREQVLSGLASGEYVFEVQARGTRGNWSLAPARLSFQVVGAALSRIGWSLLLGGLVLLGGVIWRLARPRPAFAPPPAQNPVETPAETPRTASLGLTLNADQQQMIVPVGTGYEIVELGDILYLEASGNYAKLHRRKGPRMFISCTLLALETTLPEDRFFRIHKSYLVNLFEVQGYESGRGGSTRLKSGVELPVAVRRKSAFVNQLREKVAHPVSVYKKS